MMIWLTIFCVKGTSNNLFKNNNMGSLENLNVIYKKGHSKWPEIHKVRVQKKIIESKITFSFLKYKQTP
jgi:hypothetical protein